eukprot:TRINITY_DN25258_c0_g1_i1.p1 TRINITY_DN25258_c0_g1~~TRINITY_DN25258_c0_g1_i1.p1  ORF type:complete len:463 (-),score=58.53 TRINITY_DN25258_c0_g1_i1:88-1443(-)
MAMAANAASDSEDTDWVHHTEANSWVQFLAGHAADFPAPDHPDWNKFLTGSLQLSTVLLVVGAVTSASTLFVLCRVHIKAATQRPPWTHFGVICIGTLICFLFAVYFCVVEGQKGYPLATSNLAAAVSDAQAAGEVANVLNASVQTFTSHLNVLYDVCPGNTHKFLGEWVRQVKVEVSRYNVAVHTYASSMHGIPEQLLRVESLSFNVGTLMDCCVSLPILLFAVCYIGIGLVIVQAECPGPKWLRRCSCLHIPFVGAACVAPAVLLVAFAAAAELSVGVMSSAFCADADNITLSYAEEAFGPSSNGFDLTRHYVTGLGPNLALRHLGVAQASIASCKRWVETYIVSIEHACPNWNLSNLTQDLHAANSDIHRAVQLLEPAHVYPFYRSTVHYAICGTAVSELSLLVMFQLLLGFVCLPALACAASCLLDSLVVNREFGHAFSRLGHGDEL